ncbi:uncharacterized protein LOC125762019 isoform X1 [Anopheles funestus]|uniref:uncharacterized protein LOC125762019 isoform X1 n=1 Tax=Anopheles funestus TaxID=62324 RepID=UPI0020C5FEFD|nr:uncharacterized protein LOC125762019 isoform X1 [Anopheles funestus]
MEQTSAVESRAKQIEKEYLSSLADLNVNSKPLINMLTILAEENLEYAQIIVNAVEKHLTKVAPDVKLPILYLVDSIVKNVGKQYQTLFSQVIVNMFCGVFQTVNEKIREKMFSLRQTWNDVFQQSKLYTLDVKINSIDPGWPITAQLKPKASSIHLNPMFLKGNQEPTLAMQQKLRDKQRELLQLQARKLELELLTTKKRILEQEKQLSIQAESVAKDPSAELVKPLEGVGGPASLLPASGGVVSTTVPPPGVMPKSRIAPVPQGMINMVKTRDPRLAKQQATTPLGGTTLTSAGSVNNPHTALGPLSIPPPTFVSSMMDSSNHSISGSKQSSVLGKDQLSGRNRRTENVLGDSASTVSLLEEAGAGARSKKQISSSTSSTSSSSHKSRRDNDAKRRKDRKEQASSSSSGSSRSSAKGKSSSTSRSGGSATEKRKQCSHSTSDGSPHGRKSPHSPGKKKPSEKSTSSHHSHNDSPKGAGKSRTETKNSPDTFASSSKSSHQARNNNLDSKKHQHTTDEYPSVAGSNSASCESQSVDFRFAGTLKRIKIDEPVPEIHSVSEDTDDTIMTMMGQKASEVQNNSATDDEEALSAMIAKDIDLRAIPLQLITPKHTAERDLSLNGPKNDACGSGSSKESPSKRSEEMEDADGSSSGKKRTSTTNYEEPNAKKSKAEIIDALFGNEDVDLRQLPIGDTLLISGDEQELDFSKMENVVDQSRSPLSEKTNSNHAAKLTDMNKHHEKDKLGRPLLYNKLPDDPIERRRSINSLAKPEDIDHRFQHQNMFNHDATEDDDNSMDSMNANIKTIISQAQEQMEKGEITLDQYNILMKQVFQLNETQKIRQAQRIESVKRHDQTIIRIDDNASMSGDDDVIVTSVTVPTPGVSGMRMNEQKDGSIGNVNDFRGKIHPIDGKPPLGKAFEVVPFAGIGIPPTSIPPPDIRAQRDPRRIRESKWNRVEPVPGPAWANRPGGVGPVVGGPMVVPPMVASGIRPGMVVPSPWEQAPFQLMTDGMPRFPTPPGPLPLGVLGGVPPNGMAMMNPALPKMNDCVRTINIDGIQREIRFYEEIAVIFINWDEPKEIGFQKGARMVVVDDRETFELGFNEPYKSVSIENKVYQMRLGAPTRELYIDDSWYECYFGDKPSTITLDGKPRVFKIAGPAPQVKIGESRKDLVAGKINMIVDAKYMIPVFLDCKMQMFEVYGVMHRLQFADFLLTVLIDEQPFPVDYGGLPMLVRSRERDYYIRFTALPNGLVPGRVYIRDMIRTPLYRDLRTPPKDPGALSPPIPLNPPFAPPTAALPALSASGPPGIGFGAMNNIPPAIGPPHHKSVTAANSTSTGLDYLANLMPSMAMQAGATGKNAPGYRIEADEKTAVPGGAGIGATAASTTQQPNTSTTGLPLPLLTNINVEELYKKIVAAGIITKKATSSSPTPPQSGDGGGSSVVEKDSKDAATKSKEKDKSPIPEIEPVLLDKPDTLKKRQTAIVYQLFSGMQCSSCGVRFPPEQTMKYSQHLDWHFRQNRRDRDSARKAHSRKWYYDVSDWIQYEEIEDLEEREKNWFETQQTDQGDLKKGGSAGGGGGLSSSAIDGDEFMSHDDSPQPSCPAGSDESDRQCHMCHDMFEHFYSEETEEWHLKNAIRIEGSTYHPLCYEDYKASLTMSESTLGNGTLGVSLDESQKTDEMMDTSEGVADGEGNAANGKSDEGKSRTSKTGNEMEDDDDDDDVIVLPTVEPVVEEILDDDGDEQPNGENEAEGGGAAEDRLEEPAVASGNVKSPRQPEFQERQIDEDLFIQEPNIEVTDLDEIEDKPVDELSGDGGEANDGQGESGVNSLSSLLRVKIKQEPKEEDEADEEDALFEDVGTIESSLIEVDEPSPITNNAAEEELCDDVQVESIPSPSESSNQMGLLVQPKASLDGNVELQDAPQSATVVPNKIKINITKTKAQQQATSGHNHGLMSSNDGETADANNGVNVNNFNDDSQGIGQDSGGTHQDHGDNALEQDGVGSWEERHEKNGSEQSNNKETSTIMATAAADAAEVTFEETTDVAYELKERLKGIDWNRQPRVTSGLEASGLCSIM